MIPGVKTDRLMAYLRDLWSKGESAMGLHLCPIEPDDWTNGPNDPEPVECRECDGGGKITDEKGVENVCPRCDGYGVTDPPEPDFEPDYSELF